MASQDKGPAEHWNEPVLRKLLFWKGEPETPVAPKAVAGKPPVDRLREDEALPNLTGVEPLVGRQEHSSGWGINE
jgi:hypothetical protein